ncbi:tc5 transposase [Ancylostoma duodenale]|uniref:Tc5 transposase n=1 Tax=Ancylostoma duodenale TaxID=51022 RepID=A0A0C2DN33_9BILA|nr:tc5 transposase [Ancylostoma duodenale]
MHEFYNSLGEIASTSEESSEDGEHWLTRSCVCREVDVAIIVSDDCQYKFSEGQLAEVDKYECKYTSFIELAAGDDGDRESDGNGKTDSEWEAESETPVPTSMPPQRPGFATFGGRSVPLEKKYKRYITKRMVEDKKSQREKTSFFTVKSEDNEGSTTNDAAAANSPDASNEDKISSLRRTFCAVCGTQDVAENMCRPPQELEQTMVLLACLCIQKIMKLPKTTKYQLKPLGVMGRYICERHYIQAASYIGKKTEKLWGMFPRRGLYNVPGNILYNLVGDIRVHGDKIDKDVVLTISDIVNFFDNCLVTYYKNGTWKTPRKERNDEQGNGLSSSNERHAKDAPDVLAFHSQSFLSRSAFFSICSQMVLRTDSIARNFLPHKKSNGCNQGIRTVANLEEESSHDDSRPRNRVCTLCGAIRAEEETRSGSANVRQNLVLMSCLLLCNVADMESAKPTYEGMLNRRRRLCKLHYIQAANWIGEEVQKAWGKFPIHGLFGVPRKTLMNLLARLQYCVDALGVVERLEKDDLARFYGDCLTKYRQMDGWREEALQNKEEITQASLEAIQTILAEATPSGSPGNIVRKPAKRTPENKDPEIKSERRMICALCGISWPHFEMRCSEFNRPQNAMLLSSLVALEVERKYLCKSHYMEAAAFINGDLRRSRNPSDNANTVASGSNVDLLSRLQPVVQTLDEQVTLRTCDLVRFGGEFIANYRKESGKKKCGSAIEQVLNSFLNEEMSPPPDTPAKGDIKTEPGTSGTHLDTVFVDPSKGRTYCCALCGLFQPMKELCMTTVPHSRTLIMLSYSLKSNIITPDLAKKFYEDIFRSRQRICKRHFQETAAYISNYVMKVCGSVPKGGLNDVPSDVLYCLLEDVHKHLSEVEEFVSLEYGNVTNFLDFCPPKARLRRNATREQKKDNDVETRGQDEEKDVDPEVQDERKDLQDEDKDGELQDEDRDVEMHEFYNSLGEIASTLEVSSDEDDHWLRVRNVEIGDDEDLENDDNGKKDSDWEAESENPVPTFRPPQRPGFVTFGSKSISLEKVKFAIAYYRLGSKGYRPLSTMRHRFRWIRSRNDMEKLRTIEKQVGEKALKKYKKYIMKRMIEDKKAQRDKTSFFTVKSEGDESSTANDAAAANSPDASDEGKISSLRRTFCAVCGTQDVPENMRRPPQEVEHTVVLLACLRMQRVIELPETKNVYSKPLGVMGRYICKRHYMQAASYIGKKIEKLWGKFPRGGLCNVPGNILCNLLRDLRVYSYNIDKDVVLTSSHIVNFFDGCLATYYKNDGWNRRRKERNDEQSNGLSSSSEFHAKDASESLFKAEQEAALLEEANAADLVAHSSLHSLKVEEESLPAEDVKPSCSTDCSVNRLRSSEIPSSQEEQRLESGYPVKQEDDFCGTKPVLTEQQRYIRLQNCASLLECSSNELLLSRLVTFGERWILYDMEEQTARCVNEKELPKKLESHQRKLLLAVWWTAAGAVHHAFHRNCDAITEEWYCEGLVSMHRKLPLQQRSLRNETRTGVFFSAGINKLVSRWKKCLEANGDYFDE